MLLQQDPTVDADYLLKNYSNEVNSVENLVRSILDKGTDNDYMQIEIRGSKKISEIKEYHGIRVNLIGFMGNTKTPFSIDFGVGDTIIPSEVTRTLPVLLEGFENPRILTYSLESTISEKLDAIIRFMEATGRMKDFYDIYYLATSFEFEGRKIQAAIHETFLKRKTSYERDSIQIINRLSTNDAIINRWNTFCKKVLKYKLDLNEVVELVISFTDPPFQSMVIEEKFLKNWNSTNRCYE